MGKNRIISITAVVLVLGLYVYVFLPKETEKTAYINSAELYEAFDYKKELEKELQKVGSEQNRILDSLRLNLETKTKEYHSANSKDQEKIAKKIQYMEELYVHNKRTYEQQNENLTITYQERIQTQLNTYLKEYGAAHKYRYIFGVQGTGNLVYAKEEDNITKEVIKFVNQRYQDK